MKKTLSLLLILINISAFSQNKKGNPLSDKISYNIYGFMRCESYYDSYKGVNSAMDNYYLFPLYDGFDATGKQINQQGDVNSTAMATRIGLIMKGPEVLNAKTSATIETDFSGISNAYAGELRLRKAFIKLDWKNSSLLFGQNWHPFYNGHSQFYPKVGGLNTGSPFNPFNRSPQIDFNYRYGKLSASATVLYENQYCSKGFYSGSNYSANMAKRNAIIPEMVLGLNYNSGKVTAGIAGQFNVIKPINITYKNYPTDELNTSFASMAFLGYNSGKLYILAKGIIGENMTNMTMIGGYGVKSYNNTTGKMTYTNYTSYSTFLNIVYGEKIQLGLFAGISGNMGTGEALYNFKYSTSKLPLTDNACTLGLMPNMKNVYRVSPHVTYKNKNINVIAEYEMTAANYGIGNFNFEDGLYDSTVKAINHRLALTVMFLF